MNVHWRLSTGSYTFTLWSLGLCWGSIAFYLFDLEELMTWAFPTFSILTCAGASTVQFLLSVKSKMLWKPEVFVFGTNSFGDKTWTDLKWYKRLIEYIFPI